MHLLPRGDVLYVVYDAALEVDHRRHADADAAHAAVEQLIDEAVELVEHLLLTAVGVAAYGDVLLHLTVGDAGSPYVGSS